MYDFKYQQEEIKQMQSLINDHVQEIISLAGKEKDIIKYKTDPQHDLEKELWECDNRLRFVFLSYALAIYMKFGRVSTINGIIRFQEEQDNIYLNVKKNVNGIWVPDVEAIEKYKLERWKSPHQVKRGLDFSDKGMTSYEVEFTNLYLGEEQVIYTGKHDTLLRHSVGDLGSHFHIQCDPDEYTSIRRRNY